jgi:RNA polymerase sigma factor (sigma-70 family)
MGAMGNSDLLWRGRSLVKRALDDLESRSDEDLMTAFQAGELEAFDRIYLRHSKPIRAYHSVRWPREAEDLTQETFICVARSPQSYNPERGLFRPWLYGIAAHAQSDYWRRHMLKWAKLVLFDDMGTNVHDSSFIELAQKSRAVVDDTIEASRLLLKLATIDREILFLHHIEGYSDMEIANILNARRPNMQLVAKFTLKGISSRRRRAEHKLQSEW